jgi:hypothetical protein
MGEQSHLSTWPDVNVLNAIFMEYIKGENKGKEGEGVEEIK